MDGSSFNKLYDFVYKKPNSPHTGLIVIDPNLLTENNTLIYSQNTHDQKNTEVLVPIEVNKFKNILRTQFSITWDPTVATFVGTESFGLNGFSPNSFGKSQV